MSDLEEGYYWAKLREAVPTPIPFIAWVAGDGWVYAVGVLRQAFPLRSVEIISSRLLPESEPRRPTRAESEAWLRKFCEAEGLYEGAYEHLVNDEYIYGRSDIDTSGDFWLHYCNVTGGRRPEFGFRCSC